MTERRDPLIDVDPDTWRTRPRDQFVPPYHPDDVAFTCAMMDWEIHYPIHDRPMTLPEQLLQNLSDAMESHGWECDNSDLNDGWYHIARYIRGESYDG